MFPADGMTRAATLSPCGTWRYHLHRRWASGKLVVWIMLNPSIADAAVDDPTIRRCIGFSRAWGYAALTVVNLYGLRATDPAGLRDHPHPVGPDNDQWLVWTFAPPQGLIVAAWGATVDRAPDGGARVARVLDLARGVVPLHCLGTTKDGHPRHPLRVLATAQCEPYVPGGDAA
jgi:hypothetical protein